MKDFEVRKFYTYQGPNFYLDRPALVFNLYLDPNGCRCGYYKEAVLEKFPKLETSWPDRMVVLFAEVLIQILKCDIDLCIGKYAISEDGDDYVIAVEYMDKNVAEDAVYFTQDWFRAMTKHAEFDFDAEFKKVQEAFNKTPLGGPTLYSLIEGGLRRNIPVFYLFEENEFQWGYGKKNVRGRSTTFSVDGIKDTEFTMFKDMVKDFLLMCGFPTPTGKNCFSEEEITAEAETLGFPLVVKPVAGHKGQGVVTGIETMEGVIKAFKAVEAADLAAGKGFEGAIAEQQIYGTDHRLLAVKGKFVAALERVPAYVDGNGQDTIQNLIEVENATEVRADTARSPLCKIKMDQDLLDYLALQHKALETVPAEGERVFLRRVANISAGGVSINVTDKIHPRNIKMVEDIAGYFQVTCLGIDVLSKDISKAWDEDRTGFGIIEINAGPGVFMHLAPAIGGSIDVPGRILEAHFPVPIKSRIPIVMGHNLSLSFCNNLLGAARDVKPELFVAALTDEGIHFNGEFFHKNPDHDQNVKIILRNPRVEFAVFNHTTDDILDQGTFHQGADVVILNGPSDTEEILERDVLPGGYVVKTSEDGVRVFQNGQEQICLPMGDPAQLENTILDALKTVLSEVVRKYD